MVVGQSFVTFESKVVSLPTGAMENVIHPNPFLNLDDGTEYQILERVNALQDLSAVMGVCKRWKRLGEHTSLVISCIRSVSYKFYCNRVYVQLKHGSAGIHQLILATTC